MRRGRAAARPPPRGGDPAASSSPTHPAHQGRRWPGPSWRSPGSVGQPQPLPPGRQAQSRRLSDLAGPGRGGGPAFGPVTVTWQLGRVSGTRADAMAIRVGLAARAGLKDSQLNGQIQIADVAAPADSDGGLSRCMVTVTSHTGRRTVAGIDAGIRHLTGGSCADVLSCSERGGASVT